MSRPLSRHVLRVTPQAAAHLLAAMQRIGVGVLFFGLAALLAQLATLATAWLWLLAALLQGWGLGCLLYGVAHLYQAWAARQHPQRGEPDGLGPQPGAGR